MWNTLKLASVALVFSAAPALAGVGAPSSMGDVNRVVAAAAPSQEYAASAPISEPVDFRPGHRHRPAPWQWRPHRPFHPHGPHYWFNPPRPRWDHPGPGPGFHNGPRPGFRDGPHHGDRGRWNDRPGHGPHH